MQIEHPTHRYPIHLELHQSMPYDFDIAEVAHILDVSKGTAYGLIRDMNYIRIGKKLLVSEQALEAYIREHSTHSKTEMEETV